jgi:hypothetical protein
MSIRPIIDAGPGLNFLSANKERLLIAVLGTLSAPETVRDEVLRKSRQDDRFRAAAAVWIKLTTHDYIQILSDDVTPELATVVQRIGGLPVAERMKHSKDLGETMVIAHAVVAAESGQPVTVLIDDGPGAAIVTSEIRRLQRLGSSGQSVGSITLASTLTVLGRAASTQHLPDRPAMRDTYRRLRELDDGLPPIEKTDLLSDTLWS